MRSLVQALLVLFCVPSFLYGQCTLNGDGYTVDIQIEAVDLILNQSGSTCNAQVVIEYDITISDGGPSWWNGELWTLQGRLNCTGSGESSFFNLPNGGGSGTVTSEVYSYNATNCGDVILDCQIEIEANGPGLTYDDLCGSVNSSSLPVAFSSFKFVKENEHSVLTWTTESEINSSIFEIERSLDGKLWNKIGEIRSSNDPTGASYEFTLSAEVVGGYYRIRNVDFDGFSNFSEIIFVNYEIIEEPTIYPNPARNTIDISYGNGIGLKELIIYNIDGRVKLQQNLKNDQTVDVSNLAKGSYSYTIITDSGVIHHGRLIKL